MQKKILAYFVSTMYRVGLFIALLSEFRVLDEVDRLQKQRGLGKAKHRKLVRSQIQNEIVRSSI